MEQQSLSLIANEYFGELPCSFYQESDSGDILLTREQIGLALEYENPRLAIGKIHGRHQDRLNRFSVRMMLRGGNQTDYSLSARINQLG